MKMSETCLKYIFTNKEQKIRNVTSFYQTFQKVAVLTEGGRGNSDWLNTFNMSHFVIMVPPQNLFGIFGTSFHIMQITRWSCFFCC